MCFYFHEHRIGLHNMNARKSAAAVSPLMTKLSRYVAAAPRQALPPAAVEATKHHLLDTIASMVSGSTLHPGQAAIAYARSLGGAPQATVVGTRLRTNVVNAALANGMLAHADETDDAHAASFSHPGCGVVAAALAMAEREHRSGTALLRAVCLGYDIGARMSLSLQPTEFRRVGHLPHCFGPTFGAAAAAAALARLDAHQVRHVFAYAAQQAGGVAVYPRDRDHIEKSFDFGGLPARNGIVAASMVASGCTAVEDVFSGERNFYAAYDESARTGLKPDPARLVRGLGRIFEVVNTDIKRWTVGLPIQAPLDALLHLMTHDNVTADTVVKLVVRIAPTGAAVVDDRSMPDISVKHLCAVLLLDGTVTFEAAHDSRRVRDPRVQALCRRIELVPDAALEKLRPQWHGIVEVTLRDGRHVGHHTKAVRGTAENPMTRDEVDDKCHRLMTPVLGTRRARALCDTVWSVERVRDVCELRPLLRA